MTVIPCLQNTQLRQLIERYAEVLKTEAHRLGDHGLDEAEFYNSGLFRGAIERVRGQFSATKRDKREFVRHILNHMQDKNFIADWQAADEANRHDYTVTMPSGRISVIELKGCLDGNNTNIFDRPPQASEFVIWSVCTNRSANPQRNVWSGIHTRLSAEIIARQQRVDGLIIWDMMCGTGDRPCPKIAQEWGPRITAIGPYELPPPCLYVFPATAPTPRGNPHPPAQQLADVHFLHALHECFQRRDEEVNYVDFRVEHTGSDITRTTHIQRGGVTVMESGATAIRRT